MIKSYVCSSFCNMGMPMSFMGKGFGTSQLITLVLGTVYNQFMEREINNSEDFHKAILDIFTNFNSALPGKHYDVPSRKKIEECFAKWKNAKDEDKRMVFIKFMKKVSFSKLDDSSLITGLVTPPAAMAAKRVGEKVPQLNVIKAIPDVIFVPAATLLALISVKLSRRILLGDTASEGNQQPPPSPAKDSTPDHSPDKHSTLVISQPELWSPAMDSSTRMISPPEPWSPAIDSSTRGKSIALQSRHFSSTKEELPKL